MQTTYKTEELVVAHKHSFHNKDEVLKSTSVRCFYCDSEFLPADITEWVDEGQTAICPACGIDALIGNASDVPMTNEFFYDMGRYWFGGN